jgi:hypothetical protein
VAEEVAADAAAAEEHHGEHRLHRRRHFHTTRIRREKLGFTVGRGLGTGRAAAGAPSAGCESAKNRREGILRRRVLVWCVLALTGIVSLACGPRTRPVLSQPPLEAWDHGVSFGDSQKPQGQLDRRETGRTRPFPLARPAAPPPALQLSTARRRSRQRSAADGARACRTGLEVGTAPPIQPPFVTSSHSLVSSDPAFDFACLISLVNCSVL